MGTGDDIVNSREKYIFSIVLCVTGFMALVSLLLYQDYTMAPVFVTVTVADRISEWGFMGGGGILGTDGNPYTITDFQTTVNEVNEIRDRQGLQRIATQFYWNKAFQINDTYLCEFEIAPSGNYCLSNCTKISGGAP